MNNMTKLNIQLLQNKKLKKREENKQEFASPNVYLNLFIANLSASSQLVLLKLLSLTLKWSPGPY